ncbi:MAG: serine hydrolase [Bacteroidales bacterium]|nr:serine hydrolase [Bacteroidales bacterium]
MKRTLPFILFLLVFSINPLFPQKQISPISPLPDTIISWSDSILHTLSFDERIAQSIMVYAHSGKGIEHEVEITDLIRKHKIGGLIFFPGKPIKQAELTNFYQSQSSVPLLIATDAKSGYGLRLNNIIEFPSQMSLEAIQDDSLIYQMGIEIAEQNKRMGVHLNLIQVTDTNNNLLLFSEDVHTTINEIKKAVANNLITREDIDNRCRKMLEYKELAGLNRYVPIKMENIVNDLNSVSTKVLNYKLVENSITLLKNKDHIIPVKRLDTTKIATLFIGSEHLTEFQQTCSKYTRIINFNRTEKATEKQQKEILRKLDSFNLVIVGLGNLNQDTSGNFEITDDTKDFLDQVLLKKNVILTIFGNPYSLDKLNGLEKAKAIIITYQENQLFHKISSQIIFGATGARGRLPVNVNPEFKQGNGINTTGNIRLKYSFPGYAGIDIKNLREKIDSIALSGIREKAFPGCQVLVARNGSVIFHKTYGYHTYRKDIPVKKENLYDLASVTKITGPLPALIKLYDEGKIDIDKPFSFYWEDFRNSNKSDILFRDILAHQGQLIPWIPYWKNTVNKQGNFKWFTFKNIPSKQYSVKVAPDLYLRRTYKKKIYRTIRKSDLLGKKEYIYSGLANYIYPEMLENLTGENYESYLDSNFYHPLGAYTITYNPVNTFNNSNIIPTENDTFFRKQQIHGQVHDEGAIMMGGVSGNAGLFATANDLVKVMQMYLNMGSYGGEQYFSDSAMKEFTRCQFPENNNRRGLGFDKPLLNNDELAPEENYPAPGAGPSSFGHSGFTGIFTWADPEENLLYIFMSNRVYPTRENSKIYDLNIRSNILQSIYDSIIR